MVQPIQASLDWMTVLKASQALSSEIVFSSLMEKLMRILIENAGAQRGLLVNRHPITQQFAIDAIGRVDRDQINISVHETDSNREPQLPLSLITYVERTHQTIVMINLALIPMCSITVRNLCCVSPFCLREN